ncbi:hypothetical protein KIH86_22340, partial [Paenibacillus sp. HN-1]|nr:hypothetical protein [Paenibacillus sinensis]
VVTPTTAFPSVRAVKGPGWLQELGSTMRGKARPGRAKLQQGDRLTDRYTADDFPQSSLV